MAPKQERRNHRDHGAQGKRNQLNGITESGRPGSNRRRPAWEQCRLARTPVNLRSTRVSPQARTDSALSGERKVRGICVPVCPRRAPRIRRLCGDHSPRVRPLTLPNGSTHFAIERSCRLQYAFRQPPMLRPSRLRTAPELLKPAAPGLRSEQSLRKSSIVLSDDPRQNERRPGRVCRPPTVSDAATGPKSHHAPSEYQCLRKTRSRN
jgi:hypothetical protein